MSSPSGTIGATARRLRNKLPRRQGSMSSGAYEDSLSPAGRPSADTGVIVSDDEPITPKPRLLRGAITVVGSINMDYIALVPAHPGLNRHVHVRSDKSVTMPGGHGLNQAVACVRQSHYKPDTIVHAIEEPLIAIPSSSSRRDHTRNKSSLDASIISVPPPPLVPHNVDVSVKLIAMVGERDEQHIRSELRSHGIDSSHVLSTDDQTGAAHISVDPLGHSKVESHAYANDRLRPEHIPPLRDPVTGRQPDLLLVQLEIPVDTVQHAVRIAKELDPPIPVILNPAPDNTHVPEDLWAVDHLIMNAGRADELCQGSSYYPFGSPPKFAGGGGAGAGGTRRPGNLATSSTTKNLGTGARTVKEYWDDTDHFHDLGARCVIITMGQNGALGSVRERHRSNRPRKFYSGALVASHPAGFSTSGKTLSGEVKDTTGASDAFIGAYAVEVLRQIKAGEEEDISRDMEMGIKAGGLTVGYVGSMRSIPWRDEVLGTEFDGVDDPGD